MNREEHDALFAEYSKVCHAIHDTCEAANAQEHGSEEHNRLIDEMNGFAEAAMALERQMYGPNTYWGW